MSDMDLSDCSESEYHQLEEDAVDAAFEDHHPVQQALQKRKADAAAADAALAAVAESEEDHDSDATHSDDGGSEGGGQTDEAAAGAGKLASLAREHVCGWPKHANATAGCR